MSRNATASRRAPAAGGSTRTRERRAAPKPAAAADLVVAPEATGTTSRGPTVGAALRRLRAERGLSLQQLAERSGVSRAMLGQIELEQSTPTITVVWKISTALGVPFSALLGEADGAPAQILPAARARVLRSQDGSFSSRALFPFDQQRSVEFYELRLGARASEEADAHAPGTTENLVVNVGTLDLVVGDKVHHLGTGDAIVFMADVPHVYRNPGSVETLMYLVMTYAESFRTPA